MYSENFARKGANEVLSCLQWFVNNIIPETVEILRVFCDNCGGQNKNRYVFLFLRLLVDTKRFRSVHLSFPLPGHSYMPCDRDFALIEKKRKRRDKILTPSSWVEPVKESTQIPGKFNVIYVHQPLTDDLKPDSTPICKVKDYRGVFDNILRKNVPGMSKLRGLLFDENGVLGRNNMCGVENIDLKLVKSEIMNLNVFNLLSSVQVLNYEFLAIKPEKVADVKYLLKKCLLPNKVTFFDAVFGSDNVDDEVEYVE